MDQFRWVMTRFAASRETTAISDVTGSDVAAWLNGNGWAPATRRTHLRMLRSLFSYSVKMGYSASDPSRGLDMPKLALNAPEILNVKQAATVLSVCRKLEPTILPYFAICLFAGLRPDECKRLAWGDVRDAFIVVQAAKAKTRRRRLVEILPPLDAWLKLGGDLPPKRWRTKWERVTAQLGFKWGQDCMRHSFCSYALPIRGAAWTALQAGHSERILFAHYAELVPKAEAEKFWKLTPDALDAVLRVDVGVNGGPVGSAELVVIQENLGKPALKPE